MHLIHQHGFSERMRIGPTRHPVGIGPAVHAALLDDRGVARRLLHLETQRIGFHAGGTTAGTDLELVEHARRHARNEQLEHPASTQRAHHVRTPVPPVKRANHRHASRRGSPHGERRALDAVDDPWMRTQFLPQPQMTSFPVQMEIHVAQCWQKTVGIVKYARSPINRFGLDAIGQRQRLAGKKTYEKRIVQAFHRPSLATHQYPESHGAWHTGANHNTVNSVQRQRMRTQQVVWRTQFAAQQLHDGVPRACHRFRRRVAGSRHAGVWNEVCMGHC